MNSPSYLNKAIIYSFYLLFFLIPLIFFGNTSELFEFNKMWLTFGLTTIIAAAWISKMIIEKRIIITRTPLDIPLALFFISQLISTIFSLDTHVSFWGYYSRFNGGLLSTISYILLYYALVSNLQAAHVFRMFFISLISGLCTVLWGFPSHFGYDPTCLVFRGSLDTNCWTEAFKPTIRAFSTLGQPAWFAAYLDVLIPLSMAYMIINAQKNKKVQLLAYAFLSILFYACLIFANTRAGFIAFYIADIIFWVILLSKNLFNKKIILKYFFALHLSFIICNFIYGAPISSLNKFTLPELLKKSAPLAHAQTTTSATKPSPKTINITDSAQIRLIVWQGAINAWKANPIFGTGVETFAFAYYQHRPAEHNLTSEWDYLYNKAHNEYLNYLATTGIVGLGAYLSIIFVFIFLILKYIKKYKTTSSSPQLPLFNTALLSSYITILITNFFGFSVVIINLYFFLIPGFYFLLNNELPHPAPNKKGQISIGSLQWIALIITIIIAANILLSLFRYWYADTDYALGANLNKVGGYQEAFPKLQNAVETIPDEPIYKDELAINLATLSQAFYIQKDAATASQLAEKAIALDNQVIKDHPNNVVFWKNRLRIFVSLSAASDLKNQEKYFEEALFSLKKAQELAPTDAKTSFNLGLLLGQTGNLQEATLELEKTIQLKPDYYDAYIALGQDYHNLAFGLTSSTATPAASQKIQDPKMRQKAIDTYQYALDNLNPNDEDLKKTIEKWKE